MGSSAEAVPTVFYTPVLDRLAPENSPYLDQPFVAMAVALRSMLAETEAKIATAAPAEKAQLQERAEVLREWLRPKPTIPLSA